LVLPPLGFSAKLAAGATIGTSKAMAAAVLNTLRPIMVELRCETQPNPFNGQLFRP
jgi:hypothetical protein